MDLRHGIYWKDSAESVDFSPAGPIAHLRDVITVDYSNDYRPSVSPYLHSSTKRIFDIVIATLLLIAASPLLLMIALAIKATSEGPVIFRQKRHSSEKTTFEILKFRSMHVDCGADPLVPQAVKGDGRVTAIGRLIRRTSMDELPQLINVIRGEMSLIGPRPHAIAHDEKYMREIPTYVHRFLARAGITGLAQVSGARGATPKLSDMQRRVQYDLEYIRTASLALDCKILLLTAITELTGRTNAF